MTPTVRLWWDALWALSTALCRRYRCHSRNPLLRPPLSLGPSVQDVHVLESVCAPGGFLKPCGFRAPPQAPALAWLEVASDAPPPPPPSAPIRGRCAKNEEQIKACFPEQNDIRYRKIKWPSERQQTAHSLIKDAQSKCRHIQMQKRLHADKHTLRSSASGFGCPSSNSLCLMSSSSSFSLFLSRSSASISFSRSLRRFCSALPLEVAPGITPFRTIARAICLNSDLGHTKTKTYFRVWSHLQQKRASFKIMIVNVQNCRFTLVFFLILCEIFNTIQKYNFC